MSPRATGCYETGFDVSDHSEEVLNYHNETAEGGNKRNGEDNESESDEEGYEYGLNCNAVNATDEYVPDDRYDGDYKKNITTELKWSYLEEPASKNEMHGYDGPGPCLRDFATNRFNDPLEACAVAGGLDRDMISNLTFNSNQYARGKLSNDRTFCRMMWKNISVTEMYRFLGILLKMSLVGGNVEGYKSLWYPPTRINISPTCQIDVSDYPGWAGKNMLFRRFVQIRVAFHPESTKNKLDDKCHQIRYALQKLNSASARCFIPGKELSFDEGGIPSKSQYNSVRQYNNSKPDKYRIDFFILANASEGHNFIIHIDVYQGKNSENVFIPEKYGIFQLHKKLLLILS